MPQRYRLRLDAIKSTRLEKQESDNLYRDKSSCGPSTNPKAVCTIDFNEWHAFRKRTWKLRKKQGYTEDGTESKNVIWTLKKKYQIAAKPILHLVLEYEQIKQANKIILEKKLLHMSNEVPRYCTSSLGPFNCKKHYEQLNCLPGYPLQLQSHNLFMQIQTYIYWDFSITFHGNIDKGVPFGNWKTFRKNASWYRSWAG